jgi:hypothetical protein
MLGSARSGLMIKRTVAGFPPPIAAYNLNEGVGTTSADNSGNGHTLTINGAQWGTGHTGAGLTNSSTAQGASTALLAPTTALTLMAWIRPLDLPSGFTRFALGFIDNGGNTDVGFFTERGDFGPSDVFQCDIRIGGSLAAFNGGALTLNTWVHMAVTYNGSTVILYKNGVAVATVAASGTVSPGDAFYVAGWNTVAPYSSNSDIDDVRVFNSALSLAQVNSAMNTPV